MYLRVMTLCLCACFILINLTLTFKVIYRITLYLVKRKNQKKCCCAAKATARDIRNLKACSFSILYLNYNVLLAKLID